MSQRGEMHVFQRLESTNPSTADELVTLNRLPSTLPQVTTMTGDEKRTRILLKRAILIVGVLLLSAVMFVGVGRECVGLRRRSHLFSNPAAIVFSHVPNSTHVETFFSKLNHSFVTLGAQVNGEILAEEFLLCCSSLLPVIDALGSTAFAFVKNDLKGNIDTLETHRRKTGERTLQELVRIVVDDNKGTAHQYALAADKLLWIKRSLDFLCRLLERACSQPGEAEIADCVIEAYEETLKRYHSYFLKSLVWIAIRALPYSSSELLKTLAPTPDDADHPLYENASRKHCLEYTGALKRTISIINRIVAD